MFGWAILVLAEVASAPRDLCAPRLGSTSNVWERVKQPSLSGYCDLLASATAKLAARPPSTSLALHALDEADKLLPNQVSTMLLKGRALALAGDQERSFRVLSSAKDLSPTLLDDVRALLAYARVSAATQHTSEALEAYRFLLVRTSSLPIADRALVPLETGFLAMTVGGAEDAAHYFRIAEREASDFERLLAEVGVALATDRSPNVAGPRGTLSEESARRFLAALPAQRNRFALWFTPGEEDAWRATALEALGSITDAKMAWKGVAAAGGRWSEHASSKSLGAKPTRRDRTEK